MFKLTKKKVGIGIAAGAVVIAAPFAYSYWTEGGSGTGSAATGNTVDITVNQTSTNTALYPGGPATTLAGNFTNTNDGPVKIDRVTVEFAADWSKQANPALPACTPDDFTIGGSAPVGVEVPKGTGVGSWSGLTLALDNESTNQDNCKGVTVDLVYTAHALPPAP